MLGSIKNLIAQLTDAGSSSVALAGDDLRLAAAALLIRAAHTDGDFSESERARLRDLLQHRFDLDDAEAEALIAEAMAAERDAVDLYRFTRVLKDRLDHQGRCRIIEMLWHLAFADGTVSPYEDHLVWRVSDLIAVESRERIALRQRAAEASTRGDI